MIKEISLDGIMLSEAAITAWYEMVAKFAVTLMYIRGMRGEEISIPDERVQINDNGTLTIFVDIPDIMKIEMDVPADQWSYRQ